MTLCFIEDIRDFEYKSIRGFTENHPIGLT